MFSVESFANDKYERAEETGESSWDVKWIMMNTSFVIPIGFFISFFLENGCSVFGVEFSPDFLTSYQRRTEHKSGDA